LSHSSKPGSVGGVGDGVGAGQGIGAGHGIVGIRNPTGTTFSDEAFNADASVLSRLFGPSASEFLATGITPGCAKVGSEAK
jgi:hypothetical protein